MISIETKMAEYDRSEIENMMDVINLERIEILELQHSDDDTNNHLERIFS